MSGFSLTEKEKPRVLALLSNRLRQLDEQASAIQVEHLRDKTKPDHLPDDAADEYRTLQGLYHSLTGRFW